MAAGVQQSGGQAGERTRNQSNAPCGYKSEVGTTTTQIHHREGGPKVLTRGWSLYPILTWRTGFPLDVGAGLNTTNTDPGPAGNGAPGLVRADLILPKRSYYNARNQ